MFSLLRIPIDVTKPTVGNKQKCRTDMLVLAEVRLLFEGAKHDFGTHDFIHLKSASRSLTYISPLCAQTPHYLHLVETSRIHYDKPEANTRSYNLQALCCI